ncbi:protein phosphatase [Rhodopirellula rubra]|uniref:Protein phosphatase n=1 Tax=Aporhodopirellula rubra TaxID=980271 RepID=A0A7W5H9V1_9BACT|nr:protein phosphatase 2C domain-containing protein [Aporhodopirellula rubra]MBB3210486.1 protein phosphatase [Aporhodopirellula rubra]
MSDTTIPMVDLDVTNCPPAVELDMAGGSDIGQRRSQNQDHFMIAELQRQLSVIATDVPLDSCCELYGSEPGHLLVVADGMGGHSDGELASSMAVQVCARYVLDMMHWFLKLSSKNGDEFLDELSYSLSSAQEALWEQSGSDEGRMGTTVTLAYILWPRMYVIHAGDSRCYVLRDQKLQQITKDHTIAQRMVDEEVLTQKQADDSPFSHVLWNCVGGGDHPVRPEVVRFTLRSGDRILLCSDGLHGMLDQAAIHSIMGDGNESKTTVDHLIRHANNAGGRDNITAVVATCREVQ